MIDRKFLIVIVFVAFVSAAFLFFSFPAGKSKTQNAKESAAQDIAMAKLEGQMQQLKDMVSTFSQYNVALHQSFSQEKEKALDIREKAVVLQEKIKEITAQKESLIKDLSATRQQLELTQPLRRQLAQIQEALSALNFNPEKESELINELEGIKQQLGMVNEQIPGLLSENKAYRTQAQTLNTLLAKREQEIAQLKNRTQGEQAKSQVTSDTLQDLQDRLTVANRERTQLQQKVADLQSTLESLQSTGVMPQTEYQKLQNDLADSKAREAKLLAEKQAALKEAQRNKENLAQLNKKNQELEKEMTSLKSKLERLTRDYSSLQDEHDTTQLAIKQSEAELAKRKEEITYLKERLDDAESKAFEVYSKYKEMKKETAILREQSVNIQLEKEGLRDELSAAKQKMIDLQQKFQKIGSMIKTEENNDTRNVGVELLPQGKNE